MKYIALRSLRQSSDIGRAVQEDAVAGDGNATEGRQTLDEVRESGLRFENPSLVMDLDGVWILDKNARSENGFTDHAGGE